MPKIITPLSDMQIKNAKPKEKDYVLREEIFKFYYY